MHRPTPLCNRAGFVRAALVAVLCLVVVFAGGLFALTASESPRLDIVILCALPIAGIVAVMFILFLPAAPGAGHTPCRPGLRLYHEDDHLTPPRSADDNPRT